MKDLNIKDAARVLGVHHDTVKYWEEKKLIPPARRNAKNGYRVYSAAELKEIAKQRGIYEIEVDSAIHNVILAKQ